MSNKEQNIFEHTSVPIPEDAIFKISPSRIAEFFSCPTCWYQSEVLGEPYFTGSTSSTIGTIVHYLAEQYVLGNKVTREDIEEHIVNYDFNPDVDLGEVRAHYPDMAKTLINEYVRKNKPTEVERSLCHEVKNGVYLAGTYDNRTGTILVDYKNVSTKPNTDKIKWEYYIQLMAYAWLCRQEGIEIDRIRIVYTVRPTKTLPVRVFTVTQVITEEDYQAIKDVLQLISDTILLSKSNPELRYLLFKSMQLKEN